MNLLLSLLTILSICFGAYAPAQTSTPAQTSSIEQVQCEEDMPCWDCETMGNLQCGPVANELPAYEVPAPVVEQVPTISDQLQAESVQFGTYEYIPTDELCTTVYLGTGAQDLTDGDILWSVQSIIDPSQWHTYSVTLTEES